MPAVNRVGGDELHRALLLVGLAGVAGLLVNTLREHPLPYTHAARAERLAATVAQLGIPTTTAPAGTIPKLTAEAVAADLGRPDVILLDVRPDLFFAEGHLPGAKNLTRDGLETAYPALADSLRAASRVIVYCAGTHCDEAESIAAALAKLGHTNLALYPGGWAEWTAQARRIETEVAR